MGRSRNLKTLDAINPEDEPGNKLQLWLEMKLPERCFDQTPVRKETRQRSRFGAQSASVAPAHTEDKRRPQTSERRRSVARGGSLHRARAAAQHGPGRTSAGTRPGHGSQARLHSWFSASKRLPARQRCDVRSAAESLPSQAPVRNAVIGIFCAFTQRVMVQLGSLPRTRLGAERRVSRHEAAFQNAIPGSVRGRAKTTTGTSKNSVSEKTKSCEEKRRAKTRVRRPLYGSLRQPFPQAAQIRPLGVQRAAALELRTPHPGSPRALCVLGSGYVCTMWSFCIQLTT